MFTVDVGWGFFAGWGEGFGHDHGFPNVINILIFIFCHFSLF